MKTFLLLLALRAVSVLCPGATLICSNANIAGLEVGWTLVNGSGGSVQVPPGTSLVVPVADTMASVSAALGGSPLGTSSVETQATINVRVDAAGVLAVQQSEPESNQHLKDLIVGFFWGIVVAFPWCILAKCHRVMEECL